MREVPEWRAKHDDQPVPKSVFLRVWYRSNGRCGICGLPIHVSEKHDTDHVTALGLGGEHRERNLRIVHRTCHKGKTKGEVQAMRKANRVRAKHLGRKKPRTITRWRRFDGTIVEAGKER